MKKSSCKNGLTALVVIGGLLAVKKIRDRKKAFSKILDEYGIKERSPLGVADKIREMNDADYRALKESVRTHFSSGSCCCKKW